MQNLSSPLYIGCSASQDKCWLIDYCHLSLSQPLICMWQSMVRQPLLNWATSLTFSAPVVTDKEELASMAAAFATLPCKVLWRLTPKEVPDEAAVAALNLGPNTQAGRLPCQCLCLRSNATGTVTLAPDRLATCCTIFLRIKLAQSCSERALGVQVVTWVPQNDILAHPNLRAFLSHVGINSMYEVHAALCLQRHLPTLPGPCMQRSACCED